MDSRYSIENSFSTTAPGIGTGVGVNTLIARFDGERNSEAAEGTARTGSFLGLINWIAFTVLIIPALCLYLRYSSDSESIRRDAAVYGYIVCLGSLGLFMESIWTKILQARGNMTVPLLAQMAGAAFMGVGIVMFTFIPAQLIEIFTRNRDVIAIGIPAFRIIAVSFIPVSLSLTLPLFFQAIGKGRESIAVTVVRQIFLLAPLGYLLSLCGLTAFWLTFPLSDTLTVVFGLFLLRRVYKDFMREDAPVGRCP